MSNSNKQAFPSLTYTDSYPSGHSHGKVEGLTKREWLAATLPEVQVLKQSEAEQLVGELLPPEEGGILARARWSFRVDARLRLIQADAFLFELENFK